MGEKNHITKDYLKRLQITKDEDSIFFHSPTMKPFLPRSLESHLEDFIYISPEDT